MIVRRLLILSSVLIAAGGSDAQGQNKPPTSKGDSARRIFYRVDSAMMNRAALGIELRPTGTRRDTLGVFVAAVTARGPAETAGIIEGDRIAAINGIDLRAAAADVEDEYTNGLPAHRLSREVQKLTPGTRVTLRVYSAGRFRDVVVTTGRASEVLRHAGRFNFRQLGPGSGMEFRGPGGVFEFRGPGRRLELRGPDGALMLTPGTPLRIERFRGPGATRIRSLPPKTLRRAGPLRVESLGPGSVPRPFEDEVIELNSEILSELDRIPGDELDTLTESLLELERIPLEELEFLPGDELELLPSEELEYLPSEELETLPSEENEAIRRVIESIQA